MADITFIEKCYKKWKEENPDGTEHEFYILCRMWSIEKESTYGLISTNKMKYEEIMNEKTSNEKTPMDMYREGWCNDCGEHLANCILKQRCKGYIKEENNEKNI